MYFLETGNVQLMILRSERGVAHSHRSMTKHVDYSRKISLTPSSSALDMTLVDTCNNDASSRVLSVWCRGGTQETVPLSGLLSMNEIEDWWIQSKSPILSLRWSLLAPFIEASKPRFEQIGEPCLNILLNGHGATQDLSSDGAVTSLLRRYSNSIQD